MHRPTILLANDDGIHAAGIRALAEALGALGEVWVVAPESERSATSHAITLDRPLRLREDRPGWYALDGTPVDCVYVGMYFVLKGRRPDLVVAGINHGANVGTDTFYSGTVGAAREGALRAGRALAVSLAAGRPTRFDVAAELATRVAQEMVALGPRSPALVNMNVPEGEVKGLRLTSLGRCRYTDQVEERTDLRGRSYYWIGGPGSRPDPIPGSDGEALTEGFASVTPLTLDLGLTEGDEHDRTVALLSKVEERP